MGALAPLRAKDGKDARCIAVCHRSRISNHRGSHAQGAASRPRCGCGGVRWDRCDGRRCGLEAAGELPDCDAGADVHPSTRRFLASGPWVRSCFLLCKAKGPSARRFDRGASWATEASSRGLPISMASHPVAGKPGFPFRMRWGIFFPLVEEEDLGIEGSE